MKSRRNSQKSDSSIHSQKPQDSSDLRPGSRITRAEIDVLRAKVSELVENDPHKAAIILADWINRKSTLKKAG